MMDGQVLDCLAVTIAHCSLGTIPAGSLSKWVALRFVGDRQERNGREITGSDVSQNSLTGLRLRRLWVAKLWS